MPSVIPGVRQGKDYMWLESHQRRQDKALKNKPNLDSQRGSRKKISGRWSARNQSPGRFTQGTGSREKAPPLSEELVIPETP